MEVLAQKSVPLSKKNLVSRTIIKFLCRLSFEEDKILAQVMCGCPAAWEDT